MNEKKDLDYSLSYVKDEDELDIFELLRDDVKHSP
jgi:hypothetical protein